MSMGLFSISTSTLTLRPKPPAFAIPTPLPTLRLRRLVTTATVSQPPAGGKIRGIMKPRKISPEMQAICGGVPEISRTQALKQIWAYIKQHNLQVSLSQLSSPKFSPFSLFCLLDKAFFRANPKTFFVCL